MYFIWMQSIDIEDHSYKYNRREFVMKESSTYKYRSWVLFSLWTLKEITLVKKKKKMYL